MGRCLQCNPPQPETIDQAAAREYMACLGEELEARAEMDGFTLAINALDGQRRKAERRFLEAKTATEQAALACREVAKQAVGR